MCLLLVSSQTHWLDRPLISTRRYIAVSLMFLQLQRVHFEHLRAFSAGLSFLLFKRRTKINRRSKRVSAQGKRTYYHHSPFIIINFYLRVRFILINFSYSSLFFSFVCSTLSVPRVFSSYTFFLQF